MFSSLDLGLGSRILSSSVFLLINSVYSHNIIFTNFSIISSIININLGIF